jgi:hypothetical protein
MASNSNNNIVLIIIIFFIVVVLCINLRLNKDNDSNTCNLCNNNDTQNENFENNNFQNEIKPIQRKVIFENKNNIKYFNNNESPSDIKNIVEQKEINYSQDNNIDVFDYEIENFNSGDLNFEDNLNKDSSKMFQFKEINKDDTISQKFNKLLGNIETDVTEENLKLISGVEVSNKLLNYESSSIYNNSHTKDMITNEGKFKPYSGNNYRSI